MLLVTFDSTSSNFSVVGRPDRMIFYYLLLFFTRFHSDPRLGETLFNAAFVQVTPVKVVGLLTVAAALVAPRPADAAPRLKRKRLNIADAEREVVRLGSGRLRRQMNFARCRCSSVPKT